MAHKRLSHSISSPDDTPHVVFVLISLLFIPVIVVTNVLVIATIVLIRKLHTPNNYIITAIAVADLLVGLWAIPVYILHDIPETSHLIGRSRWTCSMEHIATLACPGASVTLLFVLCLDRFVAVNRPFWYQTHVSYRLTVGVIAFVFVEETAISATVVGFFLHFDEAEPSLFRRCVYDINVPYWYRTYFFNTKLGIQLCLSMCLCAQVGYVAIRHTRKIKREFGSLKSDTKLELKGQITSVKISVLLMFAFILLWAPCLLVAEFEERLPPSFSNGYTVASLLCYLSNSFVNVIVYAFSRTTYREAYAFLLTTPPHRWSELRWSLRACSCAEHSFSRTTRSRGGVAFSFFNRV